MTRQGLRGLRRVFRLSLRRRRDFEMETDEEIEFHLASRVDRLVANGMSRAEAEAEALARFGPYDESRTTLLDAARRREESLTMFERFDVIRGDLAYAVRQLRRAPLFTATVVASLALGIGANATMFGIVDRLLLRPPAGLTNVDRIMSIGEMSMYDGREYRNTTMSYPGYADYRDHVTAFSSVAAATYPNDMALGRGENATKVRGMLVTASYFDVAGARPALGRFFPTADDALPDGVPEAVVSYGFWQRHFDGERSALGKTLDIGTRRFTVVGVAPAEFTGLQRGAVDVFIPMAAATGMQFAGSQWATMRNSFWLSAWGRLAPGASQAQAEAQGTAMRRAISANSDDKPSPDARVRLQAIFPPQAGERSTSARVSALLAAVSVIVLLIACANVANLQVARAEQRRREIAVRLALGIGRARLATQLLTESVLLAALGGLAALAVVQWGGRLLGRYLLDEYSWDGSPVDARTLWFTAAVAVATGLVCGLLPAMRASGVDVTHALKEGARDGSTSRSRVRVALLLAQSALAVVLLVGAGVFVESLKNVRSIELGMDTDRAVVATMNLSAAGFKSADVQSVFSEMKERIARIPGIGHVAEGASLPFSSSYAVLFKVPGHKLPAIHDGGPYVNAVTPEYFATLGIKILRGRAFTEADQLRHARVMVITESMERGIWQGENPIGQCVQFDADSVPCTEIIGVAQNQHRGAVIQESEPMMYWVQLEHAPAFMQSRILFISPARGPLTRWIEPIRRAMQTAAPNLPYANVRPMTELYARQIRPWELGSTVFGAFGIVALVLTAVGLYSVVAYSVVQRRHEIGVRAALGAQRRDILDLVVAQGARVAVAGIAVGLVIVAMAGRLVAPLLFGVTPTDPATMIGVGTMLLSVALAASAIPAWGAARVDPTVALRAD